MMGTLTIQNNMLLRTGSAHRDYGYQIGAIGAYWVNNDEKAQNLAVNVSGNTIQDSTYGTYVRGSATGTSIFNNNTITGAPSGKSLNTTPSFTVTGAGNNWYLKRE